MLFKKSFRLAFSNWKVLCKSLLCQLLAFAMCVALATFALSNVFDDLVIVFRSNGLSEFLAHVAQSIVNNTFDVAHFFEDLAQLTKNVTDAVKSVSNMWNRVEISVFLVILVFLVYRILVSFTDVPTGCQINEFMDSNGKRPFTWFLVKKTGKSLKFVLLQTLFAVLFDMFIILGGIMIAVLMMSIFGRWAIIPSAILMMVLYALRLSYMAFALPSVVYNEQTSTRKAFREGLALVHGHFGKVFAHNLIIVVIMLVSSAVAYLFDENRWIALAISAAVNFLIFFYQKCVNFVLYYEANKLPYFHKNIYVEGTEKFNRKHQKQK